jgi:STE24 endopeptidase
MIFLVLLALALACMPVEWPRPIDTWTLRDAALSVLGLQFALIAAAARVAQLTRRRVGDPARIHDAAGFLSRWRSRHQFAQLAAYVIALYGLGWGWAMQSLGRRLAGDGPLPTGIELLILAPLPIQQFLAWLCFYDGEVALHGGQPFGGRFGYAVFQFRTQVALFLVPILILAVGQGLFRQFPGVFTDGIVRWLTPALTIALMVALPWMLRLVLRVRSLPPGELRDRLEATAKRLRFRCSDILLWDTKLGLANALIVGVLPRPRYVLLTDRLVQGMRPDEVEGVFGHEVGHVKHHHMLLYLAFLLGSAAIMSAAGDVADGLMRLEFPATYAEMESSGAGVSSWMGLPVVLVVGAYIFTVFGFLSRKCERQADLYGCRAVSCDDPDCLGHGPDTPRSEGGRGLCTTGIMTFMFALDDVARLNGMSRSRPGWLSAWQHGSIAKRVAFLDEVRLDRSRERQFQRYLWRLKFGLLVAMAILLVGLTGISFLLG